MSGSAYFGAKPPRDFSHNHPLRLPVSLDIWQRYIYFLILTPLNSILYADLTTLSSMVIAAH